MPMLWALAPIGLVTAIKFGSQRRNWDAAQAWKVFSPMLVIFAILLSGFVIYGKLVGPNVDTMGWVGRQEKFAQVDELLQTWGASPDDKVMVTNPPGYYVASGRAGVVIPNGDPNLVRSVAEKFGVRFLLLEKHHPAGVKNLYIEPRTPPEGFVFLYEFADTQVFEIEQ